ncbi:MAG TPA: hypothetical protein VFV88_04805 [Steroidobacteraceae bacterium]|jgi:hypothetical protein|nr:hypothetical protein [Steroidobacteraceae bacterium]
MSGGGGWTVLKAIGVAFGLLAMVGFGLCSLLGFAVGSGNFDILALALLGAVLAVFFGWVVFAIFRSVRKDRDPDA